MESGGPLHVGGRRQPTSGNGSGHIHRSAPNRAVATLLEVLQAIEQSLSSERGAFDLFGLFKRRHSVGWEVVVAAPWMGQRKRPTIDLLIDRLRAAGGTDALVAVAAVIVQPDGDFVDAVQRTVVVEHGLKVVGRGEYGPIEVDRGYVITSKRVTALTPVTTA